MMIRNMLIYCDCDTVQNIRIFGVYHDIIDNT